MVHAYDSSGAWIGQVASKEISGTADWTRVSVVIKSADVPAATAKLAVGVQMRAGTGTAYFDNVRLQEGDFRYQIGYDTAGNYITSITSPYGNQATLSPESTTGNTLSITDALGKQYSNNYDMMDRTTTNTFPYQGTIGSPIVNKSYTYGYDKNGNLLSVTDPNGATWASFQYNEQDQVKRFDEKVTWGGTQYTNPWTNYYDSSNRLNKTVLPAGQYAQMGYDNKGRLKDLSFGNGTTETKRFSYSYDLNNNLKTYGTGTSNFTADYDNMNRVTKVTEPTTTNYVQNTYNDEGSRTKLSVHYGATVWDYDYTYDASGKSKKFHDVAYNRDSWFLFDEAERPVKSYNSNGTATFYEYDREGRITQLRTEKAGETIDKFRYEYDARGSITKIWSDMDGSWIEYIYDALGQLLQEKYSDNTTIEYQYDEMGNRTKVIKNGITTTYTYNAEKNRLVSAGSQNYSYDANGNVTSDGTYSYVWADDNKLKEVKQGTTTIASFTYDALGNRETMTAGGETKTFHYDGDRVSYVYESSGKLYRFAYDHSGHPIFMSYQGNQYWYHYDEHGNVIRMTDLYGTTIATYKYDAWGNITNKWGATGSEIVDLNPFRYAGYWYDIETNKYYLKARYYDAQIGRFLSKDPITIRIGSKLSLNAYNYGNNNPVKFVDTEGTFPLALAPVFAIPVVGQIVAVAAVIGFGIYVGYQLSKSDAGSVDGGYSSPSDVFEGTGDAAATEGGNGAVAKQGASGAKSKVKQGSKTKTKRTIKEKIKDITENPTDWEKTGESDAEATGKRNKGGRSIEEEYTNKKTGEQLWKHILKKKNGSDFEAPHYRDIPKQLKSIIDDIE